MISYPDALRLIANACPSLETGPTKLDDLLGRVPVADVCSKMNVPSFANSAMDGFALRAADTTQADAKSPVELPVFTTVSAGQAAPDGIPQQAVEIMTGAPLPTGYDTVIPVERIDAQRDSTGTAILIRCHQPVPSDQHVRHVGQDFRQGENIFRRSHAFEPHHIMGLAATGTDVVVTHRPPRIALITTGSELRTPGSKPATSAGGMIHDANGPYLQSFFTAANATLVQTEVVTDDPDELASVIKTCGDNADIVLTTGGVSAGRFDFVPAVIDTLGGETIFHRVAIRPGKPLLFARLKNGTLFFGLPGNPIAVAVGLRFFVLPALFHLQGRMAERFVPSICAAPINANENLTFFGKAHTEVDANGRLHTRLLPGQESFKISSFMQANCWAIVPHGTTKVEAGEPIQIAPLYPTEFLQ